MLDVGEGVLDVGRGDALDDAEGTEVGSVVGAGVGDGVGQGDELGIGEGAEVGSGLGHGTDIVHVLVSSSLLEPISCGVIRLETTSVFPLTSSLSVSSATASTMESPAI